MRVLSLSILAILVLNICQFAIETSGENSNNFLKHSEAGMHIIETEDVRNAEERRNDDGTQQYRRDFTINNISSSIKSNEIKSQDVIQADESKPLQIQHYRKRRHFKPNNEQKDDSMDKQILQQNKPADEGNVVFETPSGPVSYAPSRSSSENGRSDTKLSSFTPFTRTLQSVNTEDPVAEKNISRIVNKDASRHEKDPKSDSSITGSETGRKYPKKNVLRGTKLRQTTRTNKMLQSTLYDDIENRYSDTDQKFMSTESLPRVTNLENKSSKQKPGRKVAANTKPSNVPYLTDITDDSVVTTTTTKKLNTFLNRNNKSNTNSLGQTTSSYSPRPLTATVPHADNTNYTQNKKSDNETDEMEIINHENATTNDQNIVSKEYEPLVNTSSLEETSEGDEPQANTSSQLQPLALVDAKSTEFNDIFIENSTHLLGVQIKFTSIDNETDLRQTDNLEKDEFDVEGNKENDEENRASMDCPTCGKNGLTEEDVMQLRLVMFENFLAEKLRINLKDIPMDGYQSDEAERGPLPKLPVSIIEKTINDNADEIEKDQFYARDEEVMISGEDMEGDCIKDQSIGCFSFSLSNKIKFDVAEAKLWVYKTKDVNDKKEENIKLLNLERKKSGKLALQSNITNETTSMKEGWVTLDVTKAIMKWMNLKIDKKIVAIQCSTCKTRNYTELFRVEGYKPLLVVKYATSSPVIRNKRSELCDPRYDCCHRQLNVNFHNIRMVEVYHPGNMSIGYCYGECNEIQQATYNHTSLVQRTRYSNSLANQRTLFEQLKPCCVPLVLKDAFLLIMEDGEIVRKLIPKVIVEKCGCV